MSLGVKLLHSSAVTLKHIFYKQISEKEEYGIGAWLQSYHDITTSPYITASPVLAHSGQNLSVCMSSQSRLSLFPVSFVTNKVLGQWFKSVVGSSN